jgi:hypothetical protein
VPCRSGAVEKAAVPCGAAGASHGVNQEDDDAGLPLALLPQPQPAIAFGDVRHSARAVRSAIGSEDARKGA